MRLNNSTTLQFRTLPEAHAHLRLNGYRDNSVIPYRWYKCDSDGAVHHAVATDLAGTTVVTFQPPVLVPAVTENEMYG